MKQFLVVFVDADGKTLHNALVECTFAHNAPKVAAGQVEGDTLVRVRSAVGVQVSTVQQGLPV